MCQQFLADQVPSPQHTLRNIAHSLYQYQLKTLKMAFHECNEMTKDYFKTTQENEMNIRDGDIEMSDLCSDSDSDSEGDSLDGRARWEIKNIM